VKNEWTKSWEQIKENCRDYVSTQQEGSDVVGMGARDGLLGTEPCSGGLSGEVTSGGKRWA